MENDLVGLLDNAFKIFVISNESFLFAKYFDTGIDDFQNEVIKKPSIRYIQHNMWRSCVIELAKLYTNGKHNHFSFYKIITEIRKHNIENFVENSEYTSLLKNWNDIIKSNLPLINQIIKLRTKLYAHTDIDSKAMLKDIDFTYEMFEKLLATTLTLLIDLNDKILNRTLIYRPIYFNNVRIVEILAENTKMTRKERVAKALNKNHRP